MSSPKIIPVAEGTRWPSGEHFELASLPLNEDELAKRIGLPLVRGVEDGLGDWSGTGGYLPCGAPVEFVCYAHIPGRVFLRTDKAAAYSLVLDEALWIVGLERAACIILC